MAELLLNLICRPGRTESFAATKGKIVDHSGVPALTASSFNIAEVSMSIEGRDGSGTTGFSRELGVIRSLIVGRSLLPRSMQIECEAALESMIDLGL